MIHSSREARLISNCLWEAKFAYNTNSNLPKIIYSWFEVEHIRSIYIRRALNLMIGGNSALISNEAIY